MLQPQEENLGLFYRVDRSVPPAFHFCIEGSFGLGVKFPVTIVIDSHHASSEAPRTRSRCVYG